MSTALTPDEELFNMKDRFVSQLQAQGIEASTDDTLARLIGKIGLGANIIFNPATKIETSPANGTNVAANTAVSVKIWCPEDRYLIGTVFVTRLELNNNTYNLSAVCLMTTPTEFKCISEVQYISSTTTNATLRLLNNFQITRLSNSGVELQFLLGGTAFSSTTIPNNITNSTARNWYGVQSATVIYV
jgi:hypothetical protein